MAISRQTSETIAFMRYPMAIAIVFQHAYGGITRPAGTEDAWGWIIMDYVRQICSWHLTSAAVVCFFCISGYLFFQNWQTDGSPDSHVLPWNWRMYGRKLKSRFWSLLIPYLTWNIICFAIKGAWSDFSWHIFFDYDKWNTGSEGWFGQELPVSSGPIDSPLWFVRELIFMSILAPLVYWLVRYGKIVYLALLWLMAIPEMSFLPHQFMMALCFFSLGAVFSIFDVDFIGWTRKNIIPVSVAVLLLMIPLFMPDSTAVSMLHFVYITMLMLLYFGTASFLSERTHCFQSHFWSQSALVVYAGHIGVSALTFSATLVCKIIADDSRLILLAVRYFAIPFLCAAILTGVFYLLYRFIPAVTYPFVGKPHAKKELK